MQVFLCPFPAKSYCSNLYNQNIEHMIFSKQKWNNASEIQTYISVAKSSEFIVFEGPLSTAFEMFIRPLLGETVTADLIGYYNAATPTAKQLRFVELAQRANAFLALWNDYDEMQITISNAGVKRQESGETKTPYKYQEQALKKGWKDKGFAALDTMLNYLESEIATFTNYALSPNYTISKTEIVKSASEVNEYYWIATSRIIFLRLRPHFKTVIETVIAPRLGTIYSDLMTELAKATPNQKYVRLRRALVPVVVLHAVARLMRESGSITEKGLFFEALKSSEDMYVTSPVALEMVSIQAATAEGDARQFWAIAEKLLRTEFEFTSPSTARIPNRDNTDKKSFWA